MEALSDDSQLAFVTVNGAVMKQSRGYGDDPQRGQVLRSD